MATTATQNNGEGIERVANGSYIIESGDTAAAITITCGFTPRYVKVVNTDGSGGVMMEWFQGMTAGYGIKTAQNGTRSTITSLGITVSASGFVIGLDTDLNVKAEQLHWVAIG